MDTPNESSAEREMSLVGHLDELRTRLIICLSALVLGVILSLFVARSILQLLTMPVADLAPDPEPERILMLTVSPDGTLRLNDPAGTLANVDRLTRDRLRVIWPGEPGQPPRASLDIGHKISDKLYYTKPLDPVMMPLKVALIMGILLALPVLLWQIWLFVKPGLNEREKRIIKPMLLGAVVLFPIGAAFAYYMVRLVLRVMQIYMVENIDLLLDISRYLSLLTNMMLIFGVIFEIPLLLAIASRIGLVTPRFLQQYRRHAYVVLAVAAMLISPGGDPFTMLVAMVPLILLYELSIILAKPMALMHQQDRAEAESVADQSLEETLK